jgi:hypothetical protein
LGFLQDSHFSLKLFVCLLQFDLKLVHFSFLWLNLPGNNCVFFNGLTPLCYFQHLSDFLYDDFFFELAFLQLVSELEQPIFGNTVFLVFFQASNEVIKFD